MKTRILSFVLILGITAFNITGCGGGGNGSSSGESAGGDDISAGWDSPLMMHVVDDVSQANWEQTVRQLSGAEPVQLNGEPVYITSRDAHTPGSAQAAAYLRGRLESMGFAVTSQPFSCEDVISENLLVRLPGSGGNSSRVVLGAHYDSTNDEDYWDSPGANDNASGAAAVLEAARVLNGHRFTHPIDIVFFGAEEVDFCGAYAYVDDAQASGAVIIGAIILDMIGSYNANYQLTIEGEEEYRGWMGYAAEAISRYSNLDAAQTFESSDSDHVVFQQNGIPAYLLLTSDFDDSYYHTTDDTAAHIQSDFGYQATRAAVGAAAQSALIIE